MRGVEVADSSTVADHQVLKAPVIAQDGLQQAVRTTAGVVVQTLIGTHHLTHITLRHQMLKGRHIGFPEVTYRHSGQVGRMARVLRSAVYGIVFGTGP